MTEPGQTLQASTEAVANANTLVSAIRNRRNVVLDNYGVAELAQLCVILATELANRTRPAPGPRSTQK
jgi:hypothetical protein